MNLPELEKNMVPLSYRGDAATLTRIWLKNLSLGLLTFGIYWLWGRVRSRRYVWSQVYIGETPLAWTGTPSDQRRIGPPTQGWLAASVLVRWFPIVFARLLPCAQSLVGGAVRTACNGVGLIVYPMFQLASRRFQLSHTTWNGLAFGHTGSLAAYTKIYFKGIFLAACTLGVGYAHFAVTTRRYMVENCRYGDLHANYTGQTCEIRRAYVVGTIASVLTLGAYLPWHVAKLRNYHTNRTGLGPLKFVSTQEGSTLSNLWALNLLILIGTLGLGYALTRTRSMRYQLAHLAVEGDWRALQVNAGEPQAFAGLVDLLSMSGDDMLGA